MILTLFAYIFIFLATLLPPNGETYIDEFNEYVVSNYTGIPLTVYKDPSLTIEDCIGELKTNMFIRNPYIEILNTKTGQKRKLSFASKNLLSKSWIDWREKHKDYLLIMVRYLNKPCLSDSERGFFLLHDDGRITVLTIPTENFTQELFLKDSETNNIINIPTYSYKTIFVQSNFNRDSKSDIFVVEPLNNGSWRVLMFDEESNKISDWWNYGKPLITNEDMERIIDSYDLNREFIKKYADPANWID